MKRYQWLDYQTKILNVKLSSENIMVKCPCKLLMLKLLSKILMVKYQKKYLLVKLSRKDNNGQSIMLNINV